MIFEGDITQLIPQRHPIVMVDSLLDYSESHIMASLTIRDTTFLLNNDELSEAGLIEHMAQSVALHTGYCYYLKGLLAPTGYIGTIQGLNIDTLPKLGEVITSEVQILEEFMGVTLVEINSKINDRLVASGKMKTVIAK